MRLCLLYHKCFCSFPLFFMFRCFLGVNHALLPDFLFILFQGCWLVDLAVISSILVIFYLNHNTFTPHVKIQLIDWLIDSLLTLVSGGNYFIFDLRYLWLTAASRYKWRKLTATLEFLNFFQVILKCKSNDAFNIIVLQPPKGCNYRRSTMLHSQYVESVWGNRWMYHKNFDIFVIL